ncbi:hypothetical protein JXA47_10515 [Candidatus Sumerlaeota bacterium]|nr:hypothetical protein [Candidatus Sumerlaeota bacterium]
MIAVDTIRLVQWLTLLLVALMAPVAYAFGGSGVFWPSLWSLWAAPLAVIIEVGLYTMILSQQRQVRSLTPALVITGVLVLTRALCSLAGAAVFQQMNQMPGVESLSALALTFWMGSPLVIAFQVGLLILVLPMALHRWAPGFLEQKMLDKITRFSKSQSPAPPETSRLRPPPAPVVEAAPSGNGQMPHATPFIYSFKELEGFLIKMSGLEGFVMLSPEGLVIWQTVPWAAEAEALSGSLSRWLMGINRLIAPESAPRGAIVQSEKHWIAMTSLPGEIALNLFFTETLTSAQVVHATDRAREAAEALLTYRFGEEPSPTAPVALSH